MQKEEDQPVVVSKTHMLMAFFVDKIQLTFLLLLH